MPNSVELLGTYGSDETHALSAWTSTRRDMTDEKRARIGVLLCDTMMGQYPGHTSPFEKSLMHFLVTSDIATHIHIIKHRIAVSVNAESARYKELKEDHMYIPEDWPPELQERLQSDVEYTNKEYHAILDTLVKTGMPRSRAKESARFIRPYASQITQDVSFNFLSFMHFQVLRNDAHAQLEVREVAQEMRVLVEETGLFPLSFAAFDRHYKIIRWAFENYERLKDV